MAEKNPNSLQFLRSRTTQLLTLLLVAQALLFYALSFGESVPPERPLSAFSPVVGSWQLATEGYTDLRTLNVLKADDILNRAYSSPGYRVPAYLFVAYFGTQRTGHSPHSPKNCLPGSGWVPDSSGMIDVSIPKLNQTITVNRYVVSKGPEHSLVYYWYQPPHRVVASEYAAKFYLVVDALRYNRTDTALVRVLLPLGQNQTSDVESAGLDFIRNVYPALKAYLPS